MLGNLGSNPNKPPFENMKHIKTRSGSYGVNHSAEPGVVLLQANSDETDPNYTQVRIALDHRHTKSLIGLLSKAARKSLPAGQTGIPDYAKRLYLSEQTEDTADEFTTARVWLQIGPYKEDGADAFFHGTQGLTQVDPLEETIGKALVFRYNYFKPVAWVAAVSSFLLLVMIYALL